jgi:multidrug efflux pump subunit AcrB
MSLPEIDLPKLAGVAGSAVGLIIATAIFLSWVTARYVPTFDRYRALTAELRGYKDRNRRHEALLEQIRDSRRRLTLMSRASCLLCWVMVCAIVTIGAASVAVVFPPKERLTYGESIALEAVSVAGVAAVAAALTLDVIAVLFLVRENRIDRHSIAAEVQDIDEVSGGEPGGPNRPA